MKPFCQLAELARELPPVILALVNMFEDLGLMHVLGFLVAKAASTASLLHFHSFTAVDVEVDVRGDLEAKGERHHGEVEGADAVDLFERV